MTESDKPTDARERLRQNFLNHDAKQHPDRWEHLWAQDDLPWDKGFPSPALVDLLEQKKELLPTASSSKRPRALVPGCGKGYDVLLLASWGYDAFGVEAAATAVKAARAQAEGWESNDEYKVKDPQKGRGEAKFVFGDFFKNEWEKEVGSEGEGWDLIYDYTFLCALPPSLRPAWAARMSQLLAPGGRLICLEFPTYKPPSTGGPPWALRPSTYLAHLSRPGEDLAYDEEGFVVFNENNVEKTKDGLERIAHWKPERTHQIGAGTDWVSVWKKQ